ncbi:replication fork protection component Swi3-domain-containing protein [Aspergillus avenaceus]|uniref:Chromosome segregation in meiosis protein n=1 Tax=Aspergillus avenaceus TaxID=36643 RepID=A0A5N6TRS2_ASPAV|nr:replication fork protection component Swi3-domain-containing protein [Aspergillus avenaceus]
MEHNVESGVRTEPSYQNIDDLFDYDIGLDDILQNVSSTTEANTPKLSTVQDTPGLGLGLDEEVRITKKRQPVAKLDESRLLSQAGIPKLRRKAKQNLKFKGKGHEFSDAARLLNHYQIWLDDLFPRAKFRDGLAMIERLGHNRRLQLMRREWIEEEKPKTRLDSADQSLPLHPPAANITKTVDTTGTDVFRLKSSSHDSLIKAQASRKSNDSDQDLFIPNDVLCNTIRQDASENDDDLEALLKEDVCSAIEKQITTDKPISTMENRTNIIEDEAIEELEMLGRP